MKNLMAWAFVFFSTSLYAVNIDSGNNMGQESVPEVLKESRVDRVDRMDRQTKTYGSEMNDERFDDSISTGQSSTRRNSIDTPTSRPAATERCIDRAGYSYSRNDSGFAACVNQRSKMMKKR